MNHSPWFETVNAYYGKYYSITDLQIFVKADMITVEEYTEICGEEYVL